MIPPSSVLIFTTFIHLVPGGGPTRTETPFEKQGSDLIELRLTWREMAGGDFLAWGNSSLAHSIFKIRKDLSFLKQFLSKDSDPCVLTTLNNQSTSNESNSAHWNGLQAVFPSNLTKKIFLFGFFEQGTDLIDLRLTFWVIFLRIFGDIIEDFWRIIEEFWRNWFLVRRLRTSDNRSLLEED